MECCVEPEQNAIDREEIKYLADHLDLLLVRYRTAIGNLEENPGDPLAMNELSENLLREFELLQAELIDASLPY